MMLSLMGVGKKDPSPSTWSPPPQADANCAPCGLGFDAANLGRRSLEDRCRAKQVRVDE